MKRNYKILRITLKSIAWLLAIVIIIPVLLMLLLEIPGVQRYASGKVTQGLSEKIGTKVSLDRITIGFTGSLKLYQLYIEDQQKDTLLYAGYVEADLDPLKLINHTIDIRNVELEKAYANICRQSGEQDFNYAFIAKAFADTTQSQPSSWKFELDRLDLEKVRLRYIDIPGGTSVISDLNAIAVSFKSLGLDDHHLVVDNAYVDGLALALNFSKPETNASVTDTASSGTAFVFTVNALKMKASSFNYNDYTQKSLPEGIDFNHLGLVAINGAVRDIEVNGSDIKLDIKNLALQEKTGFVLNELSGSLAMKSTEIGISVRKFETPDSHLKHTLTLGLPLGKNIDPGKIGIQGNLKNEQIAVSDAIYFMPGLDTITALNGKKITISGDLKGILSDLTFNRMDVALDEKNNITGNIAVKGLPDLRTSYFDLSDLRVNADPVLIAEFIPEKSLPLDLKSLGYIHVKGSVKGYAISPAADISAQTGLGALRLKGNMNMDTSFNLHTYQGKLSTQALHLGKLLKDTALGRISMQAEVLGNGMDIKNFNAFVSSAEYNRYTYRNVTLDGSMKDQKLMADLVSKDSSLQVNLNLMVDLKSYQYAVKGEIGKVNLYAMHFMPSPFTASTRIDAAGAGNNVDSITGYVKLSDIKIANFQRSYSLDSMRAEAKLKNGIHTISLVSEPMNATLTGHFSMAELPALAGSVISDYYETGTKADHGLKQTENISLEFKTGNISALMQMFVPGIMLLDSVNLSASYTKKGEELRVKSSVGSFAYGSNQLKGVFLNAEGNHDQLGFSTGMLSYTSGTSVSIDHALVSGTLAGGDARFNIKLYDQKAPTRLDLDGVLTMRRDSFYLTMPSAAIFIRGQEWSLNKNNYLVYAPDYIYIRDLELKQGNQMIRMSSNIKATNGTAEALFSQVDLAGLAEMVGMSGYKLDGRLNGKVHVTDPMGSQGISANVNLDSLSMNNASIGNLLLSADKAQQNDRLVLNLNLNGSNRASAKGWYDMKKSAMDFQIAVFNLALHPFEPLAKAFAYKMDGKVTGNFHLYGQSNAPVVMGNMTFAGHNEIGLTATHTVYRFNDQQIVFNESSIQLDNFTLYDSLNNKAVAKGSIHHEKFQHLKFALSFDTDNFELINSGYTAEAAVYGTLFAKMNVVLSGPLEDLKIMVNVVTMKGTKLFVPLASAQAGAALPAYVHFDKIEPENGPAADSSGSKRNVKSPKIDLSKFDVSGRLRLTRDAELNIVVDPLNGDKITALGSGAFTFDFDSQNALNLYGTYTIEKGSYGFSFAGLVKKNFKIQKGSTISWSGNPEDALLDITAIYETKASRYDLVADQADFMNKDQINASKKLLPVDVYLSMKGSLTTPVITFDIKVPEGDDPMSANLVVQKISQIKNDPSELNKQVFSLIVLNKFMDENNSAGGAGGNVALEQVNQSVSKVLNTQLNRLSQDYLKGVELNVNLQALDQSNGQFAQNARISATKQLNSRISVSAGGNVNVNSNSNAGSQFAGDYSVYYKVNQNGSINLKFFRTSQQSIYTNNLNTQMGSAITYRREFNRFRYMFRREDKKKNLQAKK
ncbi:MAG: translocation/assembly module TamB domain-containing protein [Cytophagaceae bacterium]